MTEKEVHAFFLDENNQLNKSHSYKKAITTALQVNLEDSDVQRIMNYVPEIRKIRTLYQFLTVKECEVIKHELMDNHFSGQNDFSTARFSLWCTILTMRCSNLRVAFQIRLLFRETIFSFRLLFQLQIYITFFLFNHFSEKFWHFFLNNACKSLLLS